MIALTKRIVGRPQTFSTTIESPPSIRRVPSGKGFRYVRSTGGRVRDPASLARIRSLVIPPAWSEVWISPSARAPLQATGRDARGRKQYLYHPKWRAKQERAKYSRLSRFPAVLPKIKRAVTRDLKGEVGSKRQVLATVVRLLEETLIRIGNAEYARQNDSFGLTTLKNSHAQVNGSAVRLRFNGKSGKPHDVQVVDRQIAKTVRRCRDLPGELFVWTDDAGVHDVTANDVNTYLREISGEDITAKDFRTWGGSLLAVRFFRETTQLSSATRREVVAVIRRVAEELRNTSAVCRKSYIHPGVIAAFERRTEMNRGGRRGIRRAFQTRLSDEAFLRRLIKA
jgi:DNA topoisomerase-1